MPRLALSSGSRGARLRERTPGHAAGPSARPGSGSSSAATSGVPAALRAIGVRPSRRLGQNFLIDPRVAERITALVEDPQEPVIEIGPGLGALTTLLAATGRPVTAVEVDLRLAEALEAHGWRRGRAARVVRGDILDQSAADLMNAPATVIANLPYSITTPALEWIVAQGPRVRRAVLMVQREYAQRLSAKPGGKEHGSITRIPAAPCRGARALPGVARSVPSETGGRFGGARAGPASLSRHDDGGARRGRAAHARGHGNQAEDARERARAGTRDGGRDGARVAGGGRGRAGAAGGDSERRGVDRARAEGAGLPAGRMKRSGREGYRASSLTRLLAVLVLAVTAVVGSVAPSRAQDATAPTIPDTTFIPHAHEPINYYTAYDRDISRASWIQTLSFAHNASRVAFNVSASANTVNALQGIKSKGLDGDVNGSVNAMATKNWTWSLDGRFGLNSTDDDRSSTDRRENRLQLRTQYKFNPLSNVSAMGLLFAELQQDQSVGERTIPLAANQVQYASHTARDSSFTSGRRRGASGALTWKPETWLELGGTGGSTRINSTTNTIKTDFLPSMTVGAADSIGETHDNTTSPNGDERGDAHITMTRFARTSLGLVVRGNRADQQYYSLTQRAQENYKYGTRGAAFHAETIPFTSSQIALDLSIDRSYRDYQLQSRLNSLAHNGSAGGQFIVYRPLSRASLGFLFTRSNAERQVTQNGLVVSRAVNASGARRVSRRLWLDGTGSVSFFTREYVDTNEVTNNTDKDDVRGYLNAGGGYLVSQRCSTTVHFSVNRSHAVAIGLAYSGTNSVLATYQMDAALRLQASRTLTISQNYMLNANYLIYDYDEKRNNLNRIRRIDTSLIDSLFDFASIRLTHNFFFQDRGAYTRPAENEPRTYQVDQELYAQNLTIAVSIRLLNGVVAGATQSLANSRSYFPNPALNTNREPLESQSWAHRGPGATG